ncbi:GNAT family N-acetyltransferase [Gorillibacterium sp. CAU 1737]|uniref:GNAT family N-acetyltransferase n=1 Tax=Gorillibacterium sp. CAU 1737 TaxID=3140362 RepID=UPI003260C835
MTQTFPIECRQAAPSDYDEMLQLWERSVIATHSFLSAEAREAIRLEIPSYFPQLEVQLWYLHGAMLGFSAIHEGHLEMLFLDPESIGKGYGKQIMQQLLATFGVKSVDVNKDNPKALAFYQKNGFAIVRESPTDGAGRPYPILHLALER